MSLFTEERERKIIKRREAYKISLEKEHEEKNAKRGSRGLPERRVREDGDK